MAKKYTKINTPQGQVIIMSAPLAEAEEEGVTVVSEVTNKNIPTDLETPIDANSELAELQDRVSELQKENELLQQQYLDALKQNADLEAGEDRKAPNTKVILTAVAAVVAILFLNN